MPLDKKVFNKKSFNSELQKGASAYLDEADKIMKRRTEEALKYEKQAKRRLEAMAYLKKLGGK